MEYSRNAEVVKCEDLDCENNQSCCCSECMCCSVCSASCQCPAATTDHNKKMAQILGFGDRAYRLAQLFKMILNYIVALSHFVMSVSPFVIKKQALAALRVAAMSWAEDLQLGFGHLGS